MTSVTNVMGNDARPYTPVRLAPRRKLVISDRSEPTSRIAMWFGLHIVLGIMIYFIPIMATIHAWTTFVVGLWVAAVGRKIERIAYVGGYIASAEIIWRMRHAHVVWEFGKYALVAIFFIGALRTSRFKGAALPAIYFALLCPSIIVLMLSEDLLFVRNEISFNLAGPLALAVSVWFFSGVKLTSQQFRRLLLVMLGPMAVVSFIALFRLSQVSDITFGNFSNADTSGGFGPNQVSSAMGFGATIAFMAQFDKRQTRSARLLLLGFMMLLLTQTALTFAREGLYEWAIAAGLFSVLQSRSAKSGLNLLIVGVIVFGVARAFVLPHLNNFTDGALDRRISNTDTTGRSTIVSDDLDLFRKNIVLGVGPGRAMFMRKGFLEGAAAHIEFTRMLSEHGIFGLFALLAMGAMAAKAFKRARTPYGKSVAICMLGWAAAFMCAAATRLAAPSFAFGMACLTILPPTIRKVTLTGEDPEREPDPSTDEPPAGAGPRESLATTLSTRKLPAGPLPSGMPG